MYSLFSSYVLKFFICISFVFLLQDVNQFCTVESNLTVMCRCNNVHVPVILQKLPVRTKNLTLRLTNSWDGEEYDIRTVIDLRNLCLFTDLEYFKLSSNKKDIYRHFKHILIFADKMQRTFHKLKDLHINVATNYSFTPISPHLTSLKILDLSFTENLVFSTMENMINSLNTISLKTLALSNFQTIGFPGFSSQLNITSVFKLGLFEQLEELDLSRNAFGVIYPSIMDRLPNLKKLDLSYNYLVASTNDPLLVEMMVHPKLEVLLLSIQGTSLYTDDLIVDQTVRKPEEFSLQKSNEPVPRKRHLTLRTLLDCINTLDHGNMSILLSKDNSLCEVAQCLGILSPHLLKRVSCKVFESFKKHLDFTCAYFIRLPLVRNMREIHMDNLNWYARYTYRYPYQVCLIENSLRNISFVKNGGWVGIFHMADYGNQTHFASVFQQAEYVNLSYNNFHFNPEGFYANLKEIDLSGNTVSIQNKSFCQMWPGVTKLILSSVGVTTTQDMWFDECHSLKILDLSNNMINLTDSNIQIRDLCSLEMLILDRNNIDVLPKSFTDQLDHIIECQYKQNLSGRLHVSLSDNQLSCYCSESVMHTIKWFLNTNVSIINKEIYYCTGTQGRMFLDRVNLENFKHTCFHSNAMVVIETLMSAFGFVLFAVLIYVIYRYQWRIVYNLRKIKVCLCQWNNVHTTVNVINKYDAFISYCSDDRFWVHDCLMKTLESDRYGFTLCIHYRDFKIGEDISSEIVKSIHQSRKLIIVLSQTSLGRPWCQFELQQALSEAVNRGMKLAIIKLGSLMKSINDITVASILDNHVILEWHEDKDAQKVFWMKLLEYMYDNLDTCSFLCCPIGKRSLSSRHVNAFADESTTLL